MLKTIFNWFSHKNPAPESQAPVAQPEAAPYKVEAPVPVAPTAQPEPVAIPVKKSELKPTTVVKSDAKTVSKTRTAPKPSATKAPARKTPTKKIK